MLLGNAQYAVGDLRVITVNYEQFIASSAASPFIGLLVTGFTVAADDVTATVTPVGFLDTVVVFYIGGGTVNVPFTVTVNTTFNDGEVLVDTIKVTMVQP